MKILITGGRDFADKASLFRTLNLIHFAAPISCVIHGTASGADALALEWAQSRNIPEVGYPAEWNDISVAGAIVRRSRSGKLYNAIAGPQRNQRMVDENSDIQFTIAFAGGTGTADMMRRSKSANIPIIDTSKEPPKLKVSQVWKNINGTLIEILDINDDIVTYKNLTKEYFNSCFIEDLHFGIIYHLKKAAK